MVVFPLSLARGSLAEIEAVSGSWRYWQVYHTKPMRQQVRPSTREPLRETVSRRLSSVEAPARRCRNGPGAVFYPSRPSAGFSGRFSPPDLDVRSSGQDRPDRYRVGDGSTGDNPSRTARLAERRLVAGLRPSSDRPAGARQRVCHQTAQDMLPGCSRGQHADPPDARGKSRAGGPVRGGKLTASTGSATA